MTDLLTEDTLLPVGQKFVCISFLNDPNNKSTLCGIKIRGVFEKQDDAENFAKKLQSYDTLHNIYVGEMGKWLPFDPAPNSEAAGSPEYANDQLNKIMKSHIESSEKSKIVHEQYKNKQARENVEENIKQIKINKTELEEKLQSCDNEETKLSLEDKLKEIQESIKKMEVEKKKYKEQEELSTKKLEGKKEVDV